MSDPSVALQKWQVATLKGSGVLPAAVGARVYDEPPEEPTFPYVTVGDGQVIGDDADDCGDGSEIFSQIDVWSRAVGYGEAKEIAAGVRNALKAIPVLSGFVVTVAQFRQCQYLRDPDGETRHAAIQFRYLISDAS